MKVSLEDLLAYVDGRLAEDRRTAVENQIATDRKTAQTIAALEASKLPYKAAYERVATPPVPDTLKKRVEEWSAVSQAASSDERRPDHRFAQLAASVLLALAIGYFGGNWYPIGTDLDDAAGTRLATAEETEWVRLVADYQSLYVPETVAGAKNGHQQAEVLFSRLAEANGLQAAIPDLSGLEYRFMRAQQLGYHGQPLVQLVYLRDDGRVLALCFMRDPAPDRDTVVELVGEQRALSWRDNGQRFVIIAPENEANLHWVKDATRDTWM